MQITKVSEFVLYEGSKGREVVTALIPYQYGPRLNPSVEAICGLNFLLVLSIAHEVFLWVPRFSSFFKHCQIPIRSGMHGHVSMSSLELLSAPWVNKLQNLITKKKYKINSLCRVVKSSWLLTKIATFVLGKYRPATLLCISLRMVFFQIKYPWTGRLLWQLSLLFQNFLTTLAFGNLHIW